MAERAGLNLSTQAGEGVAPILHWDQFNQTLNNIYQRDIQNQKNIQAEYSKLNMALGEASGKVRPVDMPAYKANYDKFKQAGIMLESSKIRQNPKELAYWTAQMNDAYMSNLSLANRSEEKTKFKTDLWKDIAQNPQKYNDYPELKQMNEVYDNSTVDQIDKMGLNTYTPWLHPADTVPEKEVAKTIFGEPKTSTRLDPVKNDKGETVGNYVVQQQYYQHTPSEIARNTAFVTAGSYAYRKQWQQKYDYDKANQPDAMQSTIEKAQEIINADASQKGYKPYQLGSGYADYAAAVNIIDGQPTDVGVKQFQMDPTWAIKEKERAKKDDEEFQLRKMKLSSGLTLSRQESFYKWKQDNGITFSGREMYDAATQPNQLFLPSDAKKGTQPLTGAGLLDKRMSEIMSKAPKNLDYVILSRFNIVNMAQRRRIIDKLFGAPNATQDPQSAKELQALYSANTKGDNEEGVKAVIKYLNDHGIDVTENDINNTAVPVITDKFKPGNKIVINPATHSFEQFEQQLGQILNANKPKGSIDDDDYMNMLLGDSTNAQ